MGEFDLSLIREFRNRPALYDRSSPLFKDKIHTGHEWQEISNKLGFDVSLLKDRMLQLRNRYNLEKRRLEQLRDENPGELFESPWPLYEQLHFLSDHIRARRSYKRMLPLQPAIEMEKQSSPSNSANIETAESMAPFANGLLTVKMEEEENDSDEPESESPSASENDSHTAAPAATSAADAFVTLHHSRKVKMSPPQGNLSRTHNGNVHVPSITIRRLNTPNHSTTTKKVAAPQKQFAITSNGNGNGNTTQRHHQHHQKHQQKQQPQSHIDLDSDTTPPDAPESAAASMYGAPPTKRVRHTNTREHKYAAFGDFMSSSLLELPSQKALLLVEKFTSELVKVLIQKGGSIADNNTDDINTRTAINGQ